MHSVIFLGISCIYLLVSPSLTAMDQKPKPPIPKRRSFSKIERKIEKEKPSPTSMATSASSIDLSPTKTTAQTPEIPLIPITPPVPSIEPETLQKDPQTIDVSPPMTPSTTPLSLSSMIDNLKHANSGSQPSVVSQDRRGEKGHKGSTGPIGTPGLPGMKDDTKKDVSSKRHSKGSKVLASDSSVTPRKGHAHPKKIKKGKEEEPKHRNTYPLDFPASAPKINRHDVQQPQTPVTLIASSLSDLKSPKDTFQPTMQKRTTLASSDIQTTHHKSSKKGFVIKNDDNYLRRKVKKGNKKACKTIAAFLKYTSDPNQKSIGPQNTLLHQALYNFHHHRNIELVCLFVTNPRINSLTKNAYKRAPYQYFDDALKKEKYPQLYKILLLRATLDHVIDALLVTDPKIITVCFNENNVIVNNHKLMKKLFKVRSRIAHILPDYAIASFMRAMLEYRLQSNRSNIESLLKKYQDIPNYQDEEWGNTLVHRAVQLRDGELLTKLFDDPCVISTIRNLQDLLPSNLIDKLEKSPLHALLFTRSSLDTYLEQESFYLNQQKITRLKDTDDVFLSMILKTKEYFERIGIAQAEAPDRALPEDVILPKYAKNPQFLLDHCNFLLKKYKTENTTESEFEKQFREIKKKKDTEYKETLYEIRTRAAAQGLMESSEEEFYNLQKFGLN